MRIAPDVYRMDQIVQMGGRDSGYDATGLYWVVGTVSIQRGKVSFLIDGKKVKAPARNFAMVMPPYSVVSVELECAWTINSAVFSQVSLPVDFPQEPIAFEIVKGLRLDSLTDICGLVASARNPITISRCSRPHPKTRRLKNHLSEHFREKDRLPQLARRFGLAASKMSTLFRHDWGKPPIHFRNHLRIMDSFRGIAEESAVIDTAYEVGFNDVSRFNHAFKKAIGRSPRAIKEVKKRQDSKSRAR